MSHAAFTTCTTIWQVGAYFPNKSRNNESLFWNSRFLSSLKKLLTFYELQKPATSFLYHSHSETNDNKLCHVPRDCDVTGADGA